MENPWPHLGGRGKSSSGRLPLGDFIKHWYHYWLSRGAGRGHQRVGVGDAWEVSFQNNKRRQINIKGRVENGHFFYWFCIRKEGRVETYLKATGLPLSPSFNSSSLIIKDKTSKAEQIASHAYITSHRFMKQLQSVGACLSFPLLILELTLKTARLIIVTKIDSPVYLDISNLNNLMKIL